MPKTGDTRTHCTVESRVCNNLPQSPPYILVFGGCGRLLHTLNSIVLVSPVFGTVSSLHPTSFLMIFILVRCRDDTVPKTADTRSHCKVWLKACNNLPQPPKKRDVGRGLQKIVACSQQYLAVASCICSFWHGVIPTYYLIFTLVIMKSTEVQNPRRFLAACRYSACANTIRMA